MANKSPAYQRYPKDILSDANVIVMTAEHYGAYNFLLDICWLEGSLTTDDAELAVLTRTNDRWEQIKPLVLRCFTLVDGRYIHNRLEKERVKQEEWKRKSSYGGKQSAAKRQPKGKGGARVVQPKGNIAVCSLQFASSKELTNSTETECKVSQKLKETAFKVYGLEPIPMLEVWVEHHPEDKIIEAIIKTQSVGIRKAAYTDGILRDWLANGYPQPPEKKVKPWVKASTHDMGGANTKVDAAYGTCPACGFYNMAQLKGDEKKSGKTTKACAKCRASVEVRRGE